MVADMTATIFKNNLLILTESGELLPIFYATFGKKYNANNLGRMVRFLCVQSAADECGFMRENRIFAISWCAFQVS